MHHHWKWNMTLTHKKVHIEVEAWLLTCSQKKNLWYLSHINIHIEGWLRMDTRGEKSMNTWWRNIKLVISHDIKLVWYSTKNFWYSIRGYNGINGNIWIFVIILVWYLVPLWIPKVDLYTSPTLVYTFFLVSHLFCRHAWANWHLH